MKAAKDALNTQHTDLTKAYFVLKTSHFFFGTRIDIIFVYNRKKIRAFVAPIFANLA